MTQNNGSVHASGVLLALPELAGFTSPWRSTSYAPDHPDMPIERRFPPHVTLLTPFAEGHDEAAFERLRRVAAQHAPLDLCFERVQQFGEGGAVWLVPEPADAVLALAQAVIDEFPEYPPYDGMFPDPVPHLTVTTVGDPSTLAQVRTALAEHGPLRVRVDELGVWQRSEDDVWQLVATATLSGFSS